MGRIRNYFCCRILRNGALIHEDLWVRDGKIIDPREVNFRADVSIDCHDAVIAPGFIDVKLNGCLGVNFGDPAACTPANLAKVRAFLPTTGVTLFCPCVSVLSPKTYREVLPLLEKTVGDPRHGAGMLGVHLDGPFSNVDANEKYSIKSVDNAEETLDTSFGESFENVRMITLAPEFPGVTKKLIPELARRGVLVCLGHSNASIDEGEKAVKAGARVISHLFNGMPDFHHRDPGLVGLAASDVLPPSGCPLKFTIIADSYHVHPAALRMAYRMAKPESFMLITDGSSPLGLGPGQYTIGDVEVVVEEKDGKSRCKVAATGKLHGSCCPMHRAVRNLMEETGCTLAYALEAVSTRPAKAMGLYPTKGSLEFGADADFVMLNPVNLDLWATFLAGEKIADNQFVPDLHHVPLAIKSEYVSHATPSIYDTNLY